MATKEDLKPRYAITLDKAMEQRIRQAVNTYAKNIPHNPLSSLGDYISIGTVSLRPMYTLKVDTQYERRWKADFDDPYRGRAGRYVPDKPVWSLTLNAAPSTLTNVTHKHVIQDSEQIYTCRTCSGSGKVICSKCHGDGKVDCSSCGGRGTSACSSCNGEGSKHCYSCSGNGFVKVTRQETRYRGNVTELVTIHENKSCSSCGGRGRKICTSCNGQGSLTCSSCNGKGRIKCRTCGGDGRVLCPTCDGQKQMIHYRAVLQEFSYSHNTNYVSDTSMFSSGEFAEIHSKYKGYEVYSEVNPKSNITNQKLSELNQQMGSFLQTMLNKENVANKTIIYQKLTITRLDAYYFEYTYKGSTYQGVLMGGVFRPGNTSPISEHAEEVMDNTEHYMRCRMFPQAWHHSNIASDMNVYGTRSRAAKLLAVAKRKMGHLHEMGAVIAFIMLLLVGVPYIYNFYELYNPVLKFVAYANDPNTMGYDNYPLSMTLISIVVMWLVYLRCKRPLIPKLYYATTRLNTIGVLWGFVSFTVMSVLALVATDVIVALGGSILVEWIVGLVLWLLKAVLVIVFFIIILAWELLSWLWGLIF
ncbi:MAG: hypothetical protein ACI4AH_05220 [Muribaculaceae bacterium]